MNIDYASASATKINTDGFLQISLGDEISRQLLLLIVCILMCIGVVIVYSSGAGWAETKYSSSEYFLWRQLTFSVIGIITILLVAQLDYHFFWKTSKIILVASIVLLTTLLALKAIGRISGAARWIGFGPLRFQVSDFAKYAIIFHFSRLITEKQSYIKDLNNSYYPLLTILMTVVALVAFEPSFSTASLIALIGFMLMFIGGVNMRHLLATFSLLIPIAVVFAIAAPYRMARLLSFTSKDEKMISYQIKQSLLGLRSGEFIGHPLLANKFSLNNLPRWYDDFIFVSLSQVYGIIGAISVISLFMVFFICGINIANRASDNFGKHLAIGITISITLFAFINIAVSCHLLPTTGIELPFVSYGVSKLLLNSFGVGILMNISSNTINTHFDPIDLK